MKRKLWLLAMSSITAALAGAPARVEAEPRMAGKCIAYSCNDNGGCDFGCTCRFPAEEVFTTGECG